MGVVTVDGIAGQYQGNSSMNESEHVGILSSTEELNKPDGINISLSAEIELIKVRIYGC